MVANNADDYTNGRVNIFFPAHNNTPSDGNLTGQCVTLVKWFFGEMCDGFPDPFAARGDARYVGKNLVATGLATEVPYAQRQRGDIICYEYGTYGHIAVQLGGGNVFEENVNLGGVASRVVDGETVYASRIGSENEGWRASRNPHVYRLKHYKEQGMNPTVQTADEAAELFRGVFKREPSQDEVNSMIGRYWKERIVYLRTSQAGMAVQAMVDGYPALQAENIELRKQLEAATGGKYTPVTEQLYKKTA